MANTLHLSATLEHARISAGEKTRSHAVITLRGAGDSVDAVRPRLTVVFVIDASGSMSGEPLAQVRDSVERLSALLLPTDQVGVVSFAAQPVTIQPVDVLTPAAKASMSRRLQGLQASGQTALASGLAQGLAAFPQRLENERQVLVLLTDGAPTDGATAENLAATLDAHRPNISVVTLGYGPNHNADLLQGIAQAGGGQYWYIPDPDEANVEFARALGAQADVVIDGIEVSMKPAEGAVVGAIKDGAAPRFSSDGLVIHRPDLRADQPHTTIVGVDIDPRHETGRWRILDVVARYRRAGQREVFSERCTINVDVVHGDAVYDDDAHRKVVLADAEIERRGARAKADAGRFDHAAAVLKPMVERLEALPGYVKLDGSEVSEAVEQLIDEIMAYESRPNAAQYQEFRSSVMGVNVAQGGVHAADVKMASSTSKALMAGVAQSGSGFVVHVSEKGGPPTEMAFHQGEVTIGRVPGNDVVLSKGNISKRHTRLVMRDGRMIVVCLKSTNGTFVNGARISAPRVVAPDDQIQIGDFTVRVEKISE
jgi:Mg-chelatase subunit ChlD